MLLLLTVLLQWRFSICTSSPNIEDNLLSTDEQFISDLINSYRGQPEQEIALNLPTDEEAFNELKPILQSASPFYYTNRLGHFISSAFPEIDARGFHESVFDNLNDFNPISQRGKKYDSAMAVSARGFHGDIFTDGFGAFHPFKRNENFQNVRGKRSTSNGTVEADSSSLASKSKASPLCTPQTCIDPIDDSNRIGRQLRNSSMRTTKTNQVNGTSVSIPRRVQKQLRHKREIKEDVFPNYAAFDTVQKWKSEMDSNGFNGDVFNFDFGDNFDPIEKRVPEIDKGGFHADVFHHNFGDFNTLKRSPKSSNGDLALDVFRQNFGTFNTLKRAPEMDQIGFHKDASYRNLENFEKLRKRKPQVEVKNFNNDAFNRDFGHFDTLRKRKLKISPQRKSLTTDLFDRDFGNFYPGKRRANSGAVNADAFHSNFGIFETLKKRRPPESGELTGDAFHRSFGNFNTMKRTLAEDAFHSQFGKFETMKRKAEMNANGFDGDDDHFGNFDPGKRSPDSWIDDFEANKEGPHTFDRLRLKVATSTISPFDFQKIKDFLRNYETDNTLQFLPHKMLTNESQALPTFVITQMKNSTT